jgi:hypothetical protein
MTKDIYNFFVLYVILISHIILGIGIFTVPFISTDQYILTLIVIINIFIIIGWYIFNGCALLIVEQNYRNKLTAEHKLESNWYVNTFLKIPILGPITSYGAIPIFSLFFTLGKLIYLKK